MVIWRPVNFLLFPFRIDAGSINPQPDSVISIFWNMFRFLFRLYSEIPKIIVNLHMFIETFEVKLCFFVIVDWGMECYISLGIRTRYLLWSVETKICEKVRFFLVFNCIYLSYLFDGHFHNIRLRFNWYWSRNKSWIRQKSEKVEFFHPDLFLVRFLVPSLIVSEKQVYFLQVSKTFLWWFEELLLILSASGVSFRFSAFLV